MGTSATFSLKTWVWLPPCKLSSEVAPFSSWCVQNVIRNYGKMLVELAAVVPDGIVCFFVSYRYMDAIVSKWNDMGILNVSDFADAGVLLINQYWCSEAAAQRQGLAPDMSRLCVVMHLVMPELHAMQELMQHKLVFIETTDVLETTLALDNFRRACDCGRGAAFFSVARGKVCVAHSDSLTTISGSPAHRLCTCSCHTAKRTDDLVFRLCHALGPTMKVRTSRCHDLDAESQRICSMSRWHRTWMCKAMRVLRVHSIVLQGQVVA
jgi:Helicase C-terminal domain